MTQLQADSVCRYCPWHWPTDFTDFTGTDASKLTHVDGFLPIQEDVHYLTFGIVIFDRLREVQRSSALRGFLAGICLGREQQPQHAMTGQLGSNLLGGTFSKIQELFSMVVNI